MEKVKTNTQKWLTFAILVLCGGVMYKIYFMDGAFYIQMQEYFQLTHTEIGLLYSIAGWVTTFGFLGAVYFSDRFSKKKLLPFGLIGNGIVGLIISTLPTSFTTLVFLFCLLALFTDMLIWPTLLKSIRLLGDAKEQGRLFGFLETGRGVTDTIVNFLALGIFVALGSNAFGFRMSIVFFSVVSILLAIACYLTLEDDTISEVGSNSEKNKIAFDGMKKAIKNKNIWLVSINIFTIYSVYSGIKYFVPFLEEIYALPVALASAYGIINQYGLKMIGGSVAGYASDKLTHSPAKFIRLMFIVTSIVLCVFTILPHGEMSIYVAMATALTVSAFIFCMRAIFFAPMDEVKVDREITGAAMSLGAFIGYMPSVFIGVIYGGQLDANPGIDGYKIVFTIMAAISIIGIVISSVLVRTIKSESKTNNIVA